MTHKRPMTGIFATVNGVRYEANSYPEDGMVKLASRRQDNPDPQRFAWNAQLGLWTATVPVDQCERLVAAITVAEHLGHECQVVSIAGNGVVGLYYLGTTSAALPRDGFVQIDAGTWAKTVGIHEISRYRERYHDLLFAEWATQFVIQ